MKYLLVFALFVVVFGHNSTHPKCTYVATDGSVYDLSPLKKTTGAPYTFIDKNQNTWFFNICGDLSSMDASICPPEASVCVVEQGARFGVNAGKYDFSFYADYAYGLPSDGVEVVYGEGQDCESSKIPRKTTFEFVCNNDEYSSSLLINKFTSSNDGCYSVFILTSRFACPLSSQEDPVNLPESEDVSLFPTFLFFFALASCILCCCGCCARRRHQKVKKQKELEMVQYSNDIWIPQDNQTPVYGNPYFFYPQVPVQVVDMEQQSLVASDEQMARELQAQFDAEVRH